MFRTQGARASTGGGKDIGGWPVRKGYEFYIDSPTNQVFVILENRKMEQLKKDVVFSFWEKKDEDHTVVRFATSWATRMEDVEKLAALL